MPMLNEKQIMQGDKIESKTIPNEFILDLLGLSLQRDNSIGNVFFLGLVYFYVHSIINDNNQSS